MSCDSISDKNIKLEKKNQSNNYKAYNVIFLMIVTHMANVRTGEVSRAYWHRVLNNWL